MLAFAEKVGWRIQRQSARLHGASILRGDWREETCLQGVDAQQQARDHEKAASAAAITAGEAGTTTLCAPTPLTATSSCIRFSALIS